MLLQLFNRGQVENRPHMFDQRDTFPKVRRKLVRQDVTMMDLLYVNIFDHQPREMRHNRAKR